MPLQAKLVILEFLRPLPSFTHSLISLAYDHFATSPWKPGGQPRGGVLHRIRVFKGPEGCNSCH